MAGYRVRNSIRSCRIGRGILAAAWMCGLLAGGCLFCFGQCSVSTLFSRAFHVPGSGISPALFSAVPLFYAALMFYLKKPWWLYPMCFVRAATFSFTASGVISAAGQIGWEAVWLDAFYLYMGRLIEYWFYRRYFTGTRVLEPAVLLLIFVAAVLWAFSGRFLFMGVPIRFNERVILYVGTASFL